MVATPSITPNGGSSNTAVNVTLSSTTAGASIYYTTNGNPPTTGSSLYTAQFTLNASATVRAFAVKFGMTDSAVASATFTINTTLQVTIDTTPPVRSNGAPSGVLAAGTTIAALSLSTDENATCAYSTSDVAYTSMTVFSSTGGLSHSTNVIGLTNGSSYTYYIRCRDALNNVNLNSFPISFSVATLSSGSAGWYQNAWHYRKAVTIDHTRVAGTLTSFPVLISLVDADLQAQALSTGNDILFTAADGITKLNHELERYDPATGTLVAWVNVPSLSSSTDTKLYVYFGNAGAANQASPAAVWDGDFKGVWHLKENPAAGAPQIKDSTINGNHGTAYGSMTPSDQGPGMIGGGLTFDGKTNFINVPDSATLDSAPAVTLSTWIRTTSTGTTVNVVNKAYPCVTSGFVIWLNQKGTANGLPSFSVGNSSSVEANGANIADGAWHYLTASNDAATSNVYVDGVLAASAPRSGYLNTSMPLRMGYGTCGNYLAGSLDEVRVSGSVRSPAWIATEFSNQSAPQAFAAPGTLEAQ